MKKRPLIAGLEIIFLNSVPNDPMHLLFEGIVRTLIEIVFGLHEKVTPSTTYRLSESDQGKVNQALEN